MNEYLRKFSDKLKTIREEKGISLNQINSKTRIDIKYLEAIEDGNFSIMPEVYMKAFLKEYSNSMDIDPDEIIAKYELAQKSLNFDEVTELVDEKNEIVEKNKSVEIDEHKVENSVTTNLNKPSFNLATNNRNIKNISYLVSGILMMLFIYIIYNSFLKEPDNKIITEKKFQETITTKQNQGTNSDINKSEITPLEVERHSLNNGMENQGKNLELKIIASDKSWVRVVIDEKDNNEFILSKDMTKILNAEKQFYLHIGNSGAIKMYLNNKELEFSKAPDRVRKLIVNKNGVEYLKRSNVN